MSMSIEDARLRQAALAYVIVLYHELTEENGAPTVGTQNQAVDFILGDPAHRRRMGGSGRDLGSDHRASSAVAAGRILY